MSEDYRKKNYYRPRVLIGLDDTLESPFPPIMLCLEGSELNILRNLMQYAERRVNWVAEYHEGYYLTPDDTDWDTVESLVAGLEEKLMGCEEWTNLFEDLLAAMQCACTRLSMPPTVTPGIEPVVSAYLTSGALTTEDDNGPTVPLDAERCALAQLAYALAWEVLTEVLQPTQNTLVDILLPVALVMLAERIGPTALTIPTGTFLAMLWHLAEVYVAGELEHVKNEYIAFKEELICAAYDGLLANYSTAMHRVEEVIWTMDLSPIEQSLLWLNFGPWVFMLCKKAYDNGTPWAVANVIPGYCAICAAPPSGFMFLWSWPPCPNGYLENGGVCWEGRLCYNGAVQQSTQSIIVTPATYNRVSITCNWYSCFGSGWTVGQIEVHKWDVVEEEWVSISGLTCTNNQPIGSQNSKNSIQDGLQEGGLHRIIAKGQPAQGESKPYPFMMAGLTTIFTTV